MKKYCMANEQTALRNDKAELETKQIDPWQQYIADYEADVQEDISFTEQTVEEEFMAYITSVPQVKRPSQITDTIRFWEVCY
jgi:hypothetical protein